MTTNPYVTQFKSRASDYGSLRVPVALKSDYSACVHDPSCTRSEMAVTACMTGHAHCRECVNKIFSDLELEGAKRSNLFEILGQAKPEWGMIFVALIMCLVQGIVFPAFSLMFTEVLEVSFLPVY